MINWAQIHEAVAFVGKQGGQIKQDGFKVYKVSGDVIRIDIVPHKKGTPSAD